MVAGKAVKTTDDTVNTRLKSFAEKVLRKSKSIEPELRIRRSIEGARFFPGVWATGGSDITKFTRTYYSTVDIAGNCIRTLGGNFPAHTHKTCRATCFF